MDYAGLIKVGLYVSGLLALLFSYYWYGRKCRKEGYAKGVADTEKIWLGKVKDTYDRVTDPTDNGYSVQSKDDKWEVSGTGTRTWVESKDADDTKQ